MTEPNTSNTDNPTRGQEYPTKAMKYLNKHFPKGHKKRGDAMVLLAVASLEGKEIGREEQKEKKK